MGRDRDLPCELVQIQEVHGDFRIIQYEDPEGSWLKQPWSLVLLKGGCNRDYERIFSDLKTDIEFSPLNRSLYVELMSVMRYWMEDDPQTAMTRNSEARDIFVKNMAAAASAGRIQLAEDLRQLTYESFKIAAPYRFDEYCQALEFNRPVDKRFYLPRRKTLLPLIEALQALADDELDELFLNLPPRVGKTTMIVYFVTWVIGRNSEGSNLYSSYSDVITRAFYNAVCEILDDQYTYTWKEIFPRAKMGNRHADTETLNIDRNKHYPSLTCRSLYGTLNGACDCNGFLIADDLISGIEEALNKDRLIAAWSKVDNNLLPRAKMTAKLLWVGTRWSIIDPPGLRMDLLENSPEYSTRRYKIISVPALDENDESNFDYAYGVGFDSGYFRERRASFERNNDIASWNAQYQNEPIERAGTVFEPGDLQYFDGVLPEGAPDRAFMVVDPSFGGGDYCAGPVCLQYGPLVYVPDVIYTSEDKRVSQPLIAQLCKRYGIQTLQIEASAATESFQDGVVEELDRLEHHCVIRTKNAPNTTSKEQRIFDKSPDIREFFVFLRDGRRAKMYQMFMQNLFSFKLVGKNKNDDAPDAMAQAADYMFFKPAMKPQAVRRPF